jgi:hypothetical protein
VPDAPTPFSHAAADARRQRLASLADEIMGSAAGRGEASAPGRVSLKTVGVYERPRWPGRLSKQTLVVVLISIIISVITLLRFLF